jgi:hypothetical protein
MSTLVIAVRPAAAIQFGNIQKLPLPSRALAPTQLLKVMSQQMLLDAQQYHQVLLADTIRHAST